MKTDAKYALNIYLISIIYLIIYYSAYYSHCSLYHYVHYIVPVISVFGTLPQDVCICNAIREVSKGDCIVMGDFNHGNIQWDTLESTGVEDQQFMCLIQDNFLIQHVLEPTRGGRVLDLVLSSQKEFVDNVNIQEPLGSSDHNQVHFNIKIKSDKTKVSRCKRNFRKGNYKEMRTILVGTTK